MSCETSAWHIASAIEVFAFIHQTFSQNSDLSCNFPVPGWGLGSQIGIRLQSLPSMWHRGLVGRGQRGHRRGLLKSPPTILLAPSLTFSFQTILKTHIKTKYQSPASLPRPAIHFPSSHHSPPVLASVFKQPRFCCQSLHPSWQRLCPALPPIPSSILACKPPSLQ